MGFKREHPAEVAKMFAVDCTLKTGDSNIVVTIIEEIPLLDSTTSSLGGTLSNKEINDLRLNGRNYENLLQLRPAWCATRRRIFDYQQQRPARRDNAYSSTSF